MTDAGVRIAVRGVVQGVGFRPWVWRLAREAGVRGSVRNDAQGVTIEAYGADAAVAAFVDRIRREPPPGAASIRALDCQPVIAGQAAPERFEILESAVGGSRELSIPPDLATCPECLAEVRAGTGRRSGYAFTNCTACGPRFTIATDVPYDRPATTMAGFAMCAACRREYEDPADRRFHAQPIACPRCGPRLAFDGEGEPIAAAAAALAAGEIVAVKGLGGHHLACDATCEPAVARLRQRKRREARPFAVLVRDLAAAEALAILQPAERRLLSAPERPIVLVRRREPSPLAPSVAPGLGRIGLLLSYSPLHDLLAAAAGRPLVFTSGNLSDEPIAWRDDDARRRLGPIADRFLTHDRPIAGPCEDSLARVVAGAPVVLRRARGFVPRAVTIPVAAPVPILATGADLKNAPAIVHDDEVVLGPHVGDLGLLAASDALAEAVSRLERLLRIRPQAVAHDLHPDFASTAYALGRGEPAVAVQHHHAHVMACAAENGLCGPVLGLAWDGTGLGTDGSLWGGELLLAEPLRFRRIGTLRPLPLLGGERAVREPWRLALAALDDAFAGEPPLDGFALFRAVEPGRLAAVRGLLRSRHPALAAHGAGRWFDALGALGLGHPLSRYEGEVALVWEEAAEPGARAAYDFEIDERSEPWQIDLRPMVRAAALDLLAGKGAGLVSARFHRTLARAAAALLCLAAGRFGRHPVVLGGGCFQNSLLVEALLEELGGELAVHRPCRVPPGDGGIALGQAVVAAARIAMAE